VTYLYDELGRLVGVVDPSSDTAVYSYDAVGNLLGIARYASSTVSVIDFQPKSGPVGTTVTIQGTGFSPTPGNNSVTFNGTAATVTSATATSLVVSVPSGATTGTIGVTAPGGSATSGSAFTVTTTGGAPTITSFSPNVGLPGDSTTINGTNFDPLPTNDKVVFYGVVPSPPPKAIVSAATTTTVSAVVPANAWSGPVTLSTPGGTTTSTADFFVPVGGFTAAQVIATGRISVGGASVDVAMTTTNKLGIVVFDGVAGQRLDLGTVMLSGSGSPVVTIYRPDGATLATTGSTTARYLPPLPMSGAYVIGLQNGGATHTMRLTLSEEITGTITAGGSAVTVSVPRAGQRARLSFSGTAGERIDLGMTHTMTGLTASIKTADEATTLTSLGFSSPGELHTTLPSTASYLVVVEPGSATGSFTATLSDEVTGSITIDGSSLTLSMTRIGQRARATFSGTAGQALSLGLTSAAAGGQVTVFSPGGATLVAPVGYSAPAANVQFPALTATGTHEILVDFSGTTTGAVTLWLSQTISATTALNGSGLFVDIARPGLRAVITFPGTARHRASHVITGASLTGTLYLMRSDGTVTGWPALPGTTFVEPYSLPTTSTYYMIVQPTAANTGSLTITSYDVPADATGSLSINGGTVPVSLSVPGQNAVLSFSGSSGTAVTLRLTGNSFGCVTLVLTQPAGGVQYGTNTCATSYNYGVNLTTTGTDTLKIDPQGSATGGVTVEVTNP
jgi:YD repeat-containing protein